MVKRRRPAFAKHLGLRAGAADQAADARLTYVRICHLHCPGDPACDLSIAWTLFDRESREAFRSVIALDAGTWARGRAWTLWKALIVAAGLTETNAVEAAKPWRFIEEVVEDHRRGARPLDAGFQAIELHR